MSANEEDRLISLMNRENNLLERENYLREEMQNLSGKHVEYSIASTREDKENAGKYSQLVATNKHQFDQLKREKEAIMRQREEYVTEFMNKDEICVSNAEHVEAVCFLKREGWMGKALIHHEEFAGELSKNNIPFTLEGS